MSKSQLPKSGNRTPVNNAKRFTPVLTPLAAAIITAIYPAMPVLAQTAGNDAGDSAVEEVIVTGSRIRRDTFSSDAPMDVVLTESADVRGISDVAAMLQTTTIAAGSPQVTATVTGAGGLGTSTLSLRGLGANRTLVLLNGRRAGPSGVEGSVSSFDLNAIPLSAVERVEILKDGASSIYGSDAIAGVVNIITRKDEGAKFDAFLSQPGDSGGEQFRMNGSWGKKTDRGYFRATVDYKRQESLQRGDRDWYACDEDYIFDPETGARADLIDPRTNEPFCDGTTWGHVWVYDYADTVGDGTTNVGSPVFLLQYDHEGDLAANGVQPLPAATSPNHMTTPPGWYPVERGDALTNSLTDSNSPLADLDTFVPKSENYTVLLEGDFALTDSVSLYSEALLSRRKTSTVGTRQIWSYIYNYDSADLGYPSDSLNSGWSGAQWLSPLAIVDGEDSSVEVDYQRFVAGLRGDDVVGLDDWHWDVAVQYSKSKGEYINNIVRNDSIRTSYWRTGSCVGETTSVSNLPCVDLRWLDPDFHKGNLTQEERTFLFADDKGTTDYTQWSVEAFMSGDVMELPAGTAALAVGVHYQYDEIVDTPGAIGLAGNVWLASASGITTGDSTTKAVFAEVDVPLIADKPLIEHLAFTASARHTNVDSYGSDTTYKAGINWSLSQSVRFRSTYGTSFRAPALYELYLNGGSSTLNTRSSDPCMNWGDKLTRGEISQRMADNCAADGLPPDLFYTSPTRVITGGGAGVLSAETSDAFTAGIVWQPDFAELSVSVDFFDIEVKDEVDVIGAPNIVNACYNSPFFPNEPLCDLFDRNSATDALALNVTDIRDSYINVSRQRNRGVDLAVQYSRDIAGLGHLTVDSQHTFQIEDTVALFDATEEDKAGRAGHPDWVGNLNFGLDRDPWAFFWGVTFIGETDNYAHFGRDTVISSIGEEVRIDLEAELTMYHSLSVSREFNNGFKARLGVANALNERPPRLTNWGTSSEVSVQGQVAFYSQYDWFGRRYFLNLSKEF